jgi:hypothetical protein
MSREFYIFSNFFAYRLSLLFALLHNFLSDKWLVAHFTSTNGAKIAQNHRPAIRLRNLANTPEGQKPAQYSKGYNGTELEENPKPESRSSTERAHALL